MLLKSIYNKNFGFIEQKNVFLKMTERFKEKNLLIAIILATENNANAQLKSV